MRPMQCFVGPRCCLLPHVAWFACLCFLRGVGPIATKDTPIMGSLSVCLCAWLPFLYVFLIRNQHVSIHIFCTRIAVCDASYCYSVAHSMVCVFVHFPLRVRFISTDDTRIMVSLLVCLCPWLFCMSVISI